MRFIKPVPGEKRTVTFFALLPVRIGRETRWLEKVTVEQRAETEQVEDIEYGCQNVLVWKNLRFIDFTKPENKKGRRYAR